MSGTVRPVVRSLVACEEVVPDSVNPRRLSLLRVISTIRVTGEPRYPALQPRFAVFAVLTGGRGEGVVVLEIRHADSDHVIYRSLPQRAVFGADPLRLHGVTGRVENLVFPAPGLYWVQLRFNEDVLAELPVVLH